MNGTYTVAKSVKIVLAILVPLLMSLFGGVGIYPFFEEKLNIALALVVTPLGLGFFLFFLFILIDAFKAKLVIESDRIVKVGLLGERALPLEAIAGYRTEQRALVLVPRQAERKKMSISNAFYRDAEKIAEWVRASFTDLDAVEAREEEEKLERTGMAGAHRKVRIFSWVLTGAAVVVSLGYLVAPVFPTAQLLACILVPVAGLAAVRLSRGMLRVSDVPKAGGSGDPHVAWALLFPSFSLTIRGFADNTILDYTGLWMPVLTVFVLLMGALFVQSPVMEGVRRAGNFTPLIVGPLFAALFSVGFIITTNTVFDPSPPEVFQPSIIEKFRRTGGKSSSNHFRVAPWGPVIGVSSVMVHYKIYNRKSPGDTVEIYLRKGLYGIPSYDVEKPTAP